ncbi:MAG: hypothetical protein P8J91_06760 [Pirellulaceae bacterium]|nr:hypothetical protein [Pirellulaceae bacterium]
MVEKRKAIAKGQSSRDYDHGVGIRCFWAVRWLELDWWMGFSRVVTPVLKFEENGCQR